VSNDLRLLYAGRAVVNVSLVLLKGLVHTRTLRVPGRVVRGHDIILFQTTFARALHAPEAHQCSQDHHGDNVAVPGVRVPMPQDYDCCGGGVVVE
jgi:tRNA pseudouridine-54 N-methylase